MISVSVKNVVNYVLTVEIKISKNVSPRNKFTVEKS